MSNQVNRKIASHFSVLNRVDGSIKIYPNFIKEVAPAPVEEIAQFFMQTLCPPCKLLNHGCTGMNKEGYADILYGPKRTEEEFYKLSECKPGGFSV